MNELRTRRVLLYRGLLVLLFVGLLAWFLLAEISPALWYDPKESGWRVTLVVLPWIYTGMYLGMLGLIGRLLIGSGFSRRELEHDVLLKLFTNWRGGLSKHRSVEPNDETDTATNYLKKSQQGLVQEKETGDIETTAKLRIDLRDIRRCRVLLYRGLFIYCVLSLAVGGFVLTMLLISPDFFTIPFDSVVWLWLLVLLTVVYSIFALMYVGAYIGTELILHWFAVSQKDLKRDIFQNLFKNWHEDSPVLSNA